MREPGSSCGPMVLGYALTLVYFGLFTGGVNPLFYGANPVEVFSLYAHAAEVGQFCCLFLIALWGALRPSACERFLPVLALVLLVGGYALTLSQALAGSMPPWYTAAAGACFGAGEGACFLGYFVLFSDRELSVAVRAMVAATAVSAAFLLVIGMLPSTTALFSVLSLVVAGSAALLFKGWANRGKGSQILDASANGQGFSAISWLRSWIFVERRTLLCLLALAFVCGVQRVVSLGTPLGGWATTVIFPFGYAAGAFVFLGVLRAGDEENGYYRTCTALLAVMATCGVFSFVQGTVVQALLYAAVNIAFTMVSICMVMTAVLAARRAPMSPVVPGGLVCGAMYFSIQLGRIVCNEVTELLGPGTVSALVASVIIIYVLALAAISSGAFVRQVAQVPVPAAPHEPSAASSGPAPKTVISIAAVTEDQLRGNPIYRQRYGLTDRELDAIVLLLAGYNAADIAGLLGISANTVKTHLKAAYSKTGVHNRRELIELLNQIEGECGSP